MSYHTETRVYTLDPQQPDPAVIAQAAEVIRTGGLVAFPTETVYGLGADATDSAAVSRIFAAKARPPSDPVIVHIAAVEQMAFVALDVPEIAWTLARVFWPGPLTLILQRGAPIPANVSAGRATVAVRMPSHPIARALIQAAGTPIAAPSANTFSRPSATTAQHVLADLNGRVDIVLDGGPTPVGLESTIVDLTGPVATILRPGGITIEALRQHVPKIEVRSRLLDMDATAEAPGQLIKHYSPHAELRLFAGAEAGALAQMRAAAESLIAGAQRVGVLVTDEEAAHFAGLPVEVVSLGSGRDLAAVGARLFAALRELDGRAVDVILVHGFGHEGLGAAIWDRLLRAAEGKVIDAE